MRNHTTNNRRSRVMVTIAATIAAVAAFASLGGIDLANGVINLAQYQYGKKITICHKNKVTITVSLKAWPAHQRHGDTVGSCQASSGTSKPAGNTGTAGTAGKQGSQGSGKGQGNGNGKGNSGNGKGKNK